MSSKVIEITPELIEGMRRKERDSGIEPHPVEMDIGRTVRQVARETLNGRDVADRFVADQNVKTTVEGEAMTETHVLNETFDYCRKRSLALALSDVAPMSAKVVKLPWVSANPAVRHGFDPVATSDPTYGAEATLSAVPIYVVSKVSGELIDDWAGLGESAALATLGRLYMRVILDEFDRIWLSGQTPTDDFDGIIRQAVPTHAGAVAADFPAIMDTVAPGAMARGVWVVSAKLLALAATANLYSSVPFTSLAAAQSEVVLAGSIVGRPAVLVDRGLLYTGVEGLYGDLRSSSVVGFRTPPTFSSTRADGRGWLTGQVAIRVYLYGAFSLPLKSGICRITT